MAGVIKFNHNPYPQYFLFLENHANELIFIPKFKKRLDNKWPKKIVMFDKGGSI